jgi:hypothetical protein
MDILTLGDLYQRGFGFDWLTIVQFNPQALLVGLFIDNDFQYDSQSTSY